MSSLSLLSPRHASLYNSDILDRWVMGKAPKTPTVWLPASGSKGDPKLDILTRSATRLSLLFLFAVRWHTPLQCLHCPREAREFQSTPTDLGTGCQACGVKRLVLEVLLPCKCQRGFTVSHLRVKGRAHVSASSSSMTTNSDI